VADKDEELVELLQTFLWDRGYEAEIAADGLECIITLRAFQPDVLVLAENLLWGGCDGILSVLDEDPKLSGIPVVLIAGEVAAHEFNPAVHSRVTRLLLKPFRLGDLLERIDSAAGQVRSSRGSAGLIIKLDSENLKVACDVTDSLRHLPCYAACGEG